MDDDRLITLLLSDNAKNILRFFEKHDIPKNDLINTFLETLIPMRQKIDRIERLNTLSRVTEKVVSSALISIIMIAEEEQSKDGIFFRINATSLPLVDWLQKTVRQHAAELTNEEQEHLFFRILQCFERWETSDGGAMQDFRKERVLRLLKSIYSSGTYKLLFDD